MGKCPCSRDPRELCCEHKASCPHQMPVLTSLALWFRELSQRKSILSAVPTSLLSRPASAAFSTKTWLPVHSMNTGLSTPLSWEASTHAPDNCALFHDCRLQETTEQCSCASTHLCPLTSLGLRATHGSQSALSPSLYGSFPNLVLTDCSSQRPWHLSTALTPNR